MIHTSRQLKALVRNMSKGNSTQAQIIIRNYVMERFLERLSRSRYRDNFILKGGMLVSAMVGLDSRATLDMDAAARDLPLSIEDISTVLREIVSVPLEDGITFQLDRFSEIMDEAEYPGIRAALEARLDTMRTPLKLDISTGDVITPKEVSYSFKLMFEDRSISVLAYNLETVLAEKLETVLSRGTANTRLRDFYDLHILQQDASTAFDPGDLAAAFAATCAKRGTAVSRQECGVILGEIAGSAEMRDLWNRYQRKYAYATELTWEAVMESVRTLYDMAAGNG